MDRRMGIIATNRLIFILVSLFLLGGCDGLFADLDEVQYVGEEPGEAVNKSEENQSDPLPGAAEGLKLEGGLAPGGGYSQGQKYSLSGQLSSSPTSTVSEGNTYRLRSTIGPTVTEKQANN